VPPSSTKKPLGNTGFSPLPRPDTPLLRPFGLLPVSLSLKSSRNCRLKLPISSPEHPSRHTSTVRSSSERRSQAPVRTRTTPAGLSAHERHRRREAPSGEHHVADPGPEFLGGGAARTGATLFDEAQNLFGLEPLGFARGVTSLSGISEQAVDGDGSPSSRPRRGAAGRVVRTSKAVRQELWDAYALFVAATNPVSHRHPYPSLTRTLPATQRRSPDHCHPTPLMTRQVPGPLGAGRSCRQGD
jgi:hypothetical protein